MKERFITAKAVVLYNVRTLARHLIMGYLANMQQFENVTYNDVLEHTVQFHEDLYGKLFSDASAAYFISTHMDDAAEFFSYQNGPHPFHALEFVYWMVQTSIEEFLTAVCKVQGASFFDDVSGLKVTPPVNVSGTVTRSVCLYSLDECIATAYEPMMKMLCSGEDGETLDDIVRNNVRGFEWSKTNDAEAVCFNLLFHAPHVAKTIFDSFDNPFENIAVIESLYIADRVLFILGGDLAGAGIKPVDVNGKYDYILDDTLRKALLQSAENGQIGIQTILKYMRDWERT